MLTRLRTCQPIQPTHPRPPKVDEAITEALENDNLQLQNLAGQKYVQLNPMFGDSVASWQKRLGTVDAVLTTWTDVQKKWQALESIFVGSADIRVQLPEDSKRFAAVNADYQVRCMGLRRSIPSYPLASAFSGNATGVQAPITPAHSSSQLLTSRAHPTRRT